MLKMNDLVKLSQTPKSTVLYYVKEGLLPEPVKDKPNFHLYDEYCVELLNGEHFIFCPHDDIQ